MAGGILKVQDNKVVDENGKPVILRGAAIGGWMNMENFITGFPGHESKHRAAMLKTLGQEKYDFFFDRWLEYFFTASDAKYFASLGLNCIRIPFNYRHLEDDMNPRVLKEGGFKHLDRVINLCAKESIYTILDMHTVPGGQNPDWHSDNGTRYPAFWDYKDHQDRTVWLWEQITARYKGNPWIAGYNLLNEPADCEFTRVAEFYARLEKAVRKVDPDHALWLDGNTFAMEFNGFSGTLPNTVYSIHDYSTMGFPTGDRYKGTAEQKALLERQYLRKIEFHEKHGTPIWNGEFGPVYANTAEDGPEADEINSGRYNLLGEQLRLYDKHQIHWSIWLYKDIGTQGMVHTSPNSPWNTLLGPWLAKKKRLQLDAWGRKPSKELDAAINPLIEYLGQTEQASNEVYPPHWRADRHIRRAVLETFLSDALQGEFASLFQGKSFDELDALAASFSFENCVQREGLNKIMSDHAKVAQS